MKKIYQIFLLLCLMYPIASIADSFNVTTRIVGGKVSGADSWPWIIALVEKNQGSNYYKGQFCGASLIASRWLITAAHCVEDQTKDTMMAVAKLYNLRKDKGVSVGIKRIVMHPLYNTYITNNDIALLELKKPLTNIEPVPLVNDSQLLVNVTATIIGWGALSETNADRDVYPSVLHEAKLPIVSNETCKRAYGSGITPMMLCAGFKQGGVDTCQGDSGGPLVIFSAHQWKLAGVTSHGNGCARRQYYGIYTRISKFFNFIRDTMASSV